MIMYKKYKEYRTLKLNTMDNLLLHFTDEVNAILCRKSAEKHNLKLIDGSKFLTYPEYLEVNIKRADNLLLYVTHSHGLGKDFISVIEKLKLPNEVVLFTTYGEDHELSVAASKRKMKVVLLPLNTNTEIVDYLI